MTILYSKFISLGYLPQKAHKNKTKKIPVDDILNFNLGFTIVEALLVLFILSISFIFYFSATQTTILVGITDHKVLAHQIALRKIESIKSLPFAQWPTNGSFVDSDLNSLPQGQAMINISNYDSQGKLKKIKVDIFWNERGAQKQHTLETLIYIP